MWMVGCYLTELRATEKTISSLSSKQPKQESSWTRLSKFLDGGRFAQSQHSFLLKHSASALRPVRVRTDCPEGQVDSRVSRVVLSGHTVLNGNRNNSAINTRIFLFQSHLKLIYEYIDLFRFCPPPHSTLNDLR